MELQLLDEIEGLKAELARIKAERDLAVRVAVTCMDESIYHMADDKEKNFPEHLVWTNEEITWGDVRQVKAWDKTLEKA